MHEVNQPLDADFAKGILSPAFGLFAKILCHITNILFREGLESINVSELRSNHVLPVSASSKLLISRVNLM